MRVESARSLSLALSRSIYIPCSLYNKGLSFKRDRQANGDEALTHAPPFPFPTLHSKPQTLTPKPTTLNPKSQTLTVKLYTLNHTPYTLHPTPCTLHPTPYTLHPTPRTLHLKSDTPTPKPLTRFSIEAGIDNINLFQILRYFEKSKILQKLHGCHPTPG